MAMVKRFDIGLGRWVMVDAEALEAEAAERRAAYERRLVSEERQMRDPILRERAIACGLDPDDPCWTVEGRKARAVPGTEAGLSLEETIKLRRARGNGVIIHHEASGVSWEEY